MNFLNKLLSRKKRISSKSNTENVVLKQYSQNHALVHQMEIGKIKHGEIVEANLKNVRITRTNEIGEKSTEGELTMFFCPLEAVEVIQRLKPGDDDILPIKVILHNLDVPSNFKTGVYNMNNVLLYANGAINVMVGKNTTLEMVDM